MKELIQTIYDRIDYRLAALISGGGGIFGLITMQEVFSLAAVFLAMLGGGFGAVKAFFEMKKAIRNHKEP